MKRYLLALLLVFIAVSPVFAANKVFVAPGDTITFNDTSGTHTIGLNALGADTATYSDRIDRGAGSKPSRLEIRAVIEWDTAPVEGETCDIYIATSDGTTADADIGTTTADLTDNDDLDNMKFVGSVVAASATADKQFVDSFIKKIYTRYYSIVVHNKSAADLLQATNDLSWIDVTPVPTEIQ